MDPLPALMVLLQFLAQTDLTATGTAPLVLKGGEEGREGGREGGRVGRREKIL